MSREPARSSPDAIHLTGRQMEVLALLCEGLPNKLICRRLNIAAGTVKAHISSILRELGASSRLQAVVCARRYGLLEEFDRQEEESAERGAAAASERSANGSSAAPSGVRALN